MRRRVMKNVFDWHRKVVRWFIAIVGGTLVGLWLALHLLSRAPTLQAKLIETLNENMDADVELQSFVVKTFPTLRIEGNGLKLRLKNQRNPSPFIEIRHFEVAGGLFGLLKRQRRFTSVDLEGLRITIPPRTPDDKEAGGKAAKTITGPVLIDRITSRDAQLIIVPKDPRKEPKVWAIHGLALESVGFNRQMPFTATLSNPLPQGEIATRGSFGPWVKGSPGMTPVSGRYTFDHADLSTIHGIGGILKSAGDFSGRLADIDVRGHTSTPDFRIDVGGGALPLETDFHAVVDGTNGDTYLKQVEGKLNETPISASGAIESQPGVKGRTIALDVAIKDGSLQDVLRLAVKAQKPVMLGRIAMQAKLLLPPGKSPVIDRLNLDGHFALEQTHFTDPFVQGQIAMLSQRAQGKKVEDAPKKIYSNMRGRFVLRDGTLHLEPVGFDVPGANVQLTGVYGLRNEQLDFEGTLAMQASASEAMGGIKGFLMKPFDPLVRNKDGKGSLVPITIKGPRDQPKFGLQWDKVFK
jgi:AsmA-like C-terminal region